jgi:hypothetical protein
MKGISNMLKTSSRIQANIRGRQDKNESVPQKETDDVSFIECLSKMALYRFTKTHANHLIHTYSIFQ